jgi:hypothetical protein
MAWIISKKITVSVYPTYFGGNPRYIKPGCKSKPGWTKEGTK